MKYLFNIIILLISFNALAKTQDIVAIVNDKPITMYEFNARKKMAIALNKIDNSNSEVDRRLNRDIINTLIEEELLNQYSEKVGGKISQPEIDNAISVIEERNKMPKGYLFQYMRELGVSIESFTQQIKGELIKYNIISSLSNSIAVSPKELDVAVINSGYEDFDIVAWIFTSFDNQPTTLKQMEKFQGHLSNCANVEEKSYKDFANGEKINTKLKSLDDTTKSVILDTREEHSSTVFQHDDKFKVALVCSKKAIVSGDEINKVKAFLSNQKMSKKAVKFFKDIKSKAYIKIVLP